MSATLIEPRRPGSPASVRAWTVPDVFEVAGLRRQQPTIPAAPSLPTFSAAELAAAHEQGVEDGMRQAREAGALRAAEALSQIAHALQRSAQDATDAAQRSAEALGGVLVDAMRAAFPSLEARFGPAEVVVLVRALLPGLSREPAVRIRVAPHVAAAIAAECAALPDPERARLTVEPDAALGEADLHISWHDGAALRDGAEIRRAVLEALLALAGADERDAA